MADRLTKSYLDSQFAPLGINSSQHPSNIVRMVSALEKNGFLTKETYDKDKRTCRLYPTQKALDITEQVQNICDHAETLLLAGLSDEEKMIFGEALVRAGKNIAEKTGMERMKDEFDQ